MDRIALVSAVFLSLLLATNASLVTPKALARKGHNPRFGPLWGALVGFGGGILTALVLLTALPAQGVVGALGSVVGGVIALVVFLSVIPDRSKHQGGLPEGREFQYNILARHIRGQLSRGLFMVAIVVALIALVTLLWTIINKTVGLTAVQYAVQPEDLLLNDQPTGREVDDLSDAELEAVIAQNVRIARQRVFILSTILKAEDTKWADLSGQPVGELLKKHDYPAELADVPLNKLDTIQAASILALNLDREDLETLLFNEVIQPQVVQGWSLWESLRQREAIEDLLVKKYPQAELKWRSWLNWKFISGALDPRRPDATGLRPALYGSLMIIVLTIVVAFPIGVGAAIYLEEYAGTSRINKIIQTNIDNLAGVPSIIYGMLGLAIFVRALEPLTSGQALGADTANGRTIISAAFTLALLILPLIIINAQEAIRAVPNSLREASYGLGATQWQTIWNHVLPYAMPGILTGTILAISRAIGETAPLILVGGATFLTKDPDGPFSIFTALPLLIYRWSGLPQPEFRNAAAAAIVMLLILLLSLNSIAIILRNRFSRRLT